MTYEELESQLRRWRSMSDDGAYDFNGMLHLFLACIRNMSEFGQEQDWVDHLEVIEEPDRAFLSRLVARFDLEPSAIGPGSR